MSAAELDRPRLYVDFNEMVGKDVVLLSKEDTKRDSAGNVVELRAGMRVFVFMDDTDDAGAPSNLLATGIVERHDAKDWSAGVRWRCRIDAWK